MRLFIVRMYNDTPLVNSRDDVYTPYTVTYSYYTKGVLMYYVYCVVESEFINRRVP